MELEILGNLEHEGIIGVVEAYTQEGVVDMVLELCKISLQFDIDSRFEPAPMTLRWKRQTFYFQPGVSLLGVLISFQTQMSLTAFGCSKRNRLQKQPKTRCFSAHLILKGRQEAIRAPLIMGHCFDHASDL